MVRDLHEIAGELGDALEQRSFSGRVDIAREQQDPVADGHPDHQRAVVLGGKGLRLPAVEGRTRMQHRQTRIGRDGKPFRIWKIRSMKRDSEKHGVGWTVKGDQRLLKCGDRAGDEVRNLLLQDRALRKIEGSPVYATRR